MTLQFGASLTDDTRSANYDHNTFIIQATVRGAGFDDDPKILDLGGSGWKVQTLQLSNTTELSSFIA